MESIVKENEKNTRSIEETMDRLMNRIKEDLHTSRKNAQKKKPAKKK